VKGEFNGEGRPEILDQHRTTPLVRINGASIPVQDLGRFSHMIEEGCDRVEIELRDRQGRAVQTLLPLPKINLHMPCQGLYVPYQGARRTPEEKPSSADWHGKVEEAVAQLGIPGETERGNTLRMNGHEVSIAEDGTFTLGLRLREGDNLYTLELTNPAGYSRHVALIARATIEKPRQAYATGGKDPPPITTAQGVQR